MEYNCEGESLVNLARTVTTLAVIPLPPRFPSTTKKKQEFSSLFGYLI